MMKGEDGYIAELNINLSTDFWILAMSNMKCTRIKRFRIRGSTIEHDNLLALKPEDLTRIVRGAIRYKCEIFMFRYLDFKLFDNTKDLIGLPVSIIHIENCLNCHMFVPQIFNLKYPVTNEHRVHCASFIRCEYQNDRSLKLRESILTSLQRNYMFSIIRHWDYDLEPIEQKNQLDLGINKLLRRNIVCKLLWKDCILIVLGIRRFRKGTLLNSQPRDIILIIARMLWKRKYEYCQILGITGKLDNLDVESIYSKSQQPRENIKLLSITYNETDVNCLDSLKELKSKGLSLDKLFICSTISALDGNNGLIGLIPSLFEILTSTNTKILEIHDMNFSRDRIMQQPFSKNVYLNGDDPKMRGIGNIEFPDLPFTEIKLVRCKNCWYFLHYLLQIMNTKIDDIEKIFDFTGLSVESLDNDDLHGISVKIDRPSNNIILNRDD